MSRGFPTVIVVRVNIYNYRLV